MTHYNILIRIYYYFFHTIMLKRIYTFLEKDIGMDSISYSRLLIKRHNKRIRKLDGSLDILCNLGYISNRDALILTYDLGIKRQWGGPQYSKNPNWEGFPWSGSCRLS